MLLYAQNFYNILAPDYAAPAPAADGKTASTINAFRQRRFRRFQAQAADVDPADAQADLASLMNGPIRRQLEIIPTNVTYASALRPCTVRPVCGMTFRGRGFGQIFVIPGITGRHRGHCCRWVDISLQVFAAHSADFMKNTISQVRPDTGAFCS